LSVGPFTLLANALQNAYMAPLLVNFASKNLFSVGKFVHNFNGDSNSPRADKLFFPNLYKSHNLYILLNFYLALSRRL
jgi:hypothetical protein